MCFVMVSMVFSVQVGSVELDLPALYDSMQKLGGMQTVINKNKWMKIADILHLPKLVSMPLYRMHGQMCHIHIKQT